MEGEGAAPLILTLDLDPDGFARLDALRRAHFPPALNRVPAHVTLFHHLPGGAEEEVARLLAAEGAGVAPFAVRFAALMPLGRGVALRVEAPEAASLRGRIAGCFAGRLTPQDAGGWRPHATIQNKVSPAEARATLERLSAGFAPWEAVAEGLRLWRYRGGPWEAAGVFPFRAPGGAVAGA
ncbi:2'-5' RNA ligase family protein [Rubellimicrobium sp. CFH 75288]|uniref:2'-5' RNA ligase family protein n=1 Tax=Rubellimicrobium sp. CFH 75288 TaxID=2697034 RepID=UPI001411C1A4|nr:2'-5' RNA ligase family protein [Rubellimicrobium sp. CFH 75288]NAZ37385.1 2'-5' RNA ligase family protein [Rubellimicrobium sp. CFH 75288]